MKQAPAHAAARARRPALSTRGARILGALAVIAVALVLASRLDLSPSLSHLDVSLVSGVREGHYFATAEKLAFAAAKRHGRIRNVESEGSVDNIKRLAAASKSCEIGFALVQAGLPWMEGDGAKLELVGELPRGESLFILGKNADGITSFASLAGKRIGIGPEASGTARIAREILTSRDFAGLDLKISNHGVREQLDLAARGELDLAVFVMDEDARFIDLAVRERGLQIVGLPNVDVVARRFPFLRKGRIGAGQYDPVKMLPPTDKQVLRVNTLVIKNRCPRRSQVVGLVSVLAAEHYDFIRHNKESRSNTGLELTTAAKEYYERGGPEVADEYLPRLGDVMPPSSWIQLVMGVSVLFNLMGMGNRFALWRIDAARVRSEQEIASAFGPTVTLGDIARLDPTGAELAPAIGDEVTRVTRDLEALAARCRKLSLSVLVPMGGEMAYRYQEQLIYETLSTLRAFHDRWRRAREKV